MKKNTSHKSNVEVKQNKVIRFIESKLESFLTYNKKIGLIIMALIIIFVLLNTIIVIPYMSKQYGLEVAIKKIRSISYLLCFLIPFATMFVAHLFYKNKFYKCPECATINPVSKIRCKKCNWKSSGFEKKVTKQGKLIQ